MQHLQDQTSRADTKPTRPASTSTAEEKARGPTARGQALKKVGGPRMKGPAERAVGPAVLGEAWGGDSGADGKPSCCAPAGKAGPGRRQRSQCPSSWPWLS
jgi:hypothetical protein